MTYPLAGMFWLSVGCGATVLPVTHELEAAQQGNDPDHSLRA
jgi:hypothetical protein